MVYMSLFIAMSVNEPIVTLIGAATAATLSNVRSNGVRGFAAVSEVLLLHATARVQEPLQSSCGVPGPLALYVHRLFLKGSETRYEFSICGTRRSM